MSNILLTNTNSLDPAALAEIKSLGAKEVLILGGENAISNQVELKLEKENIATQRIAGATRFGTASQIAQQLNTKPTDVFFVYGLNYADALSVSTAAAQKNAPVIYLTTNGKLNADTAAYLAELKGYNCVKNAYVIGGDKVISDDMMNKAAINQVTGFSSQPQLLLACKSNVPYTGCMASEKEGSPPCSV
jgi:putative cell wall-binding protein